MQLKNNILIVEDDSLLTSSLKEIILAEGYAVEIAENAAQAKPLLPSAHLAIVDLRLPDAPGLQVVQELKKVNPEAEVLIVTGYADMRSAIDALNLGAFAYLEKPINPEKLFLFIKRALEKRQLTLEVRRRETEIKGLTDMTGKILNDRVRLLEEAMAREERLSKLYQGISLAFRSLDPIQAAKELLPLIAEATEANMVSFGLLGPDKKVAHDITHFRGMAPFKIEAGKGGLREIVAKTGRPVFIPDLHKYHSPNTSILAAGIKATVCYPLIVDKSIYALLFLHSLKENAFEQYRDAISCFADLCVIPLKQSSLYTEAEKARREWEIAINEVNVGIVVADKDRKIMRANSFFARLVGKPLEELAGKGICSLIHGHDEPVPDCPLEKAGRILERSRFIIGEPFLKNKKLEIIVAPVKLDSGDIIRFVNIIRDLSPLPPQAP